MRMLASLLAAGSLAMLALPAAAQDSDPVRDELRIGANEVTGNNGRVAVNVVAGDSNQQLSDAAIAIGDYAVTVQTTGQFMARTPDADRTTLLDVGPDAFSNNTGLVSVNLTSGTQNQSANLAALTIGNSGVVSDQMLAQASAPTGPAGLSAEGLDTPNDAIAISESAFGGNSGLVQINLIGGERNSSANTFALSVSAGGEP